MGFIIGVSVTIVFLIFGADLLATTKDDGYKRGYCEAAGRFYLAQKGRSSAAQDGYPSFPPFCNYTAEALGVSEQ